MTNSEKAKNYIVETLKNANKVTAQALLAKEVESLVSTRTVSRILKKLEEEGVISKSVYQRKNFWSWDFTKGHSDAEKAVKKAHEGSFRETLLNRFEGKNVYEIFYQTKDTLRKSLSTFDNEGIEKMPVDLKSNDFQYLCSIKADNKEQVFQRMQGEVWSPNGEARDLIQELGLVHTSMSVGDVVVSTETGKVETWRVCPTGWAKIDPETKKKVKKPVKKSKKKTQNESTLFLVSLIKKGKFNRKQIIEKHSKKFPSLLKSTIGTKLSDGKNEKYNPFKKWGLVIQAEDGRLSFK